MERLGHVGQHRLRFAENFLFQALHSRTVAFTYDPKCTTVDDRSWPHSAPRHPALSAPVRVGVFLFSGDDEELVADSGEQQLYREAQQHLKNEISVWRFPAFSAGEPLPLCRYGSRPNWN